MFFVYHIISFRIDISMVTAFRCEMRHWRVHHIICCRAKTNRSNCLLFKKEVTAVCLSTAVTQGGLYIEHARSIQQQLVSINKLKMAASQLFPPNTLDSWECTCQCWLHRACSFNVVLMLASVADGSPPLKQHWAKFLCSASTGSTGYEW